MYKNDFTNRFLCCIIPVQCLLTEVDHEKSFDPGEQRGVCRRALRLLLTGGACRVRGGRGRHRGARAPGKGRARPCRRQPPADGRGRVHGDGACQKRGREGGFYRARELCG